MDQDGGKDFKELCRAAANEMDPDKLMILVAEIIQAYDAREKKPNSATEREPEKDSKPPHREFSQRYRPDAVVAPSINLS